jgi:hypothetical protein
MRADALQRRVRLAADAVLRRGPNPDPRRDDFDAQFWALHDQVAPYTMTSPERLEAVRSAVRYVVAAGIPGDIVECGVWRGGSSMMAALALDELGERRQMWLYDTFDGMSEPTDRDRKWSGELAEDELQSSERKAGAWSTWAFATLDDVRANMLRTRVNEADLRFVAGKVEDTIPAEVPASIAVLRIDTDWYESTRHELEHLYPLLQPGGVLIIDDYGHWQGARQAVDEYFEDDPVFLARIDYTGRLAIKR